MAWLGKNTVASVFKGTEDMTKSFAVGVIPPKLTCCCEFVALFGEPSPPNDGKSFVPGVNAACDPGTKCCYPDDCWLMLLYAISELFV
jgi:hypothetical protein